MPPQQPRPKLVYILPILAIMIIIGVIFYLYTTRNSGTTVTPTPTGEADQGFTPFGRIPTRGTSTTTTVDLTATTTNQGGRAGIPPTLRLLSNTPVGGYGASTTASTTVVRWVDRGRGNIYQAYENSMDVVTISNTVVPKIVDSIWNKNLTAFIGPSLSSGTGDVSMLYASLQARTLPKSTKSASTTGATSTDIMRVVASTSPGSLFIAETPYELKGKTLPSRVVAYAASPKKDKIFFITNESGHGVGYTATFDGKSVTQIFTTPLTQLNAEWPEDNTIAITTKGSATYGGFLYFVNPATGAWKKIMGPILGLRATVNHTAKYVLASSVQGDSMATAIYDVAKQKYTSAVVHTLADKCVWGNFDKDTVYCAVPSQTVSAVYPDDWYKGTVSLTDKIWQIAAATGEIHLLSSIVDQSDRVIDAINLGLDPKDDYLFFMNKNDLSLWSLDLSVGNSQY